MYIAGISMITPVGGDAAMTIAAIKAGISGVEESPFYNKSFNPIKMASVPDGALESLDPSVLKNFPSLASREKRMLSLCLGAFSDELRNAIGSEPIGVLFATPENIFPFRVDGAGQMFMPALEQLLAINIDKEVTRKFSIGRAGVIHAIDYAFQYLQATGKSKILIGAVDTYRNHALLGALDAQDRLLPTNIKDGFAPGEAAVFLLLTTEPVHCLSDRRQVRLSRPGLSEETGHMYGTEPYLGNGLNIAIKQAISHHNATEIQAIYTSMNGENFWVKELGVSMIRNNNAMSENVSVEHPADCIGDVGAAVSAIALGILTKAPVGTYLIYGSSDRSWRSAICADVT